MDESRNGYRRRLNRLIALVGEENYRNDPVVHAYLRQAAASATETLQGDLECMALLARAQTEAKRELQRHLKDAMELRPIVLQMPPGTTPDLIYRPKANPAPQE